MMGALTWSWHRVGKNLLHLGLTWLLLATSLFTTAAWGQAEFEREPIRYTEAAVHDAVAKLQERIDAGKVELEYDERQGYLKSLLAALDVSVSSQMLVFSKTSFQQRIITPRSPRALYFNDEVYIGFVPRGEVLEISAVDPEQGAIFYTLAQDEVERPKFVRDRGNCISCHASSRTHNVPGHVVRSVYTSATGLPNFGAGTFQTTHASPLKERWGGWYVTGTHGRQRHMGNVVARDREQPEALDVEAGANRSDLEELVRTDRYLSGHSDIVALMVLEHQTEMHNLLTQANYTTRTACYQAASMNKILERPAGYLSESAERRIERAAEELVEYMLFVDEIELNDPIEGTSAFTEEFSAMGPRDRHGRSLRQFDLESRLFKYPCSYLIYSDAFDSMPTKVKRIVYRKLWDVLTEKETGDVYARLSSGDRQAILEILRDTKEDLPGYWRADY